MIRVSFFISGNAYQQLQTLKSETEQSTGQWIEFLITEFNASLPSCKVEALDTMPENKPDHQTNDDTHIESIDDSGR